MRFLPFRQIASVVLLLAGSNLITYAQTRGVVTEQIIAKASAYTREFLSKNGFLPPFSEPQTIAIDDRLVSGRILLGVISEAGGTKAWYAEAKGYSAIGALIAVTGMLIPFVKRRRSEPQGGGSEKRGTPGIAETA